VIRIEWSARKNRSNVAKHNVDFTEAATLFDDPAHVSINDPDHSFSENRYISIGPSANRRLIIMAHTFENDKIRIITPRKPTRSERKKYEDGEFDA
jgi:uncharacterized DUF497 family protein